MLAPQRPSKAPLVIGVLVVCTVLFVILFAVTQSKGGLGKSDADSATTTPPPPDPKTTLQGTGQAIQTSEIEIGTTVVPFATQPTLPATASYSMTMDLLVANRGTGNWRCILNSWNTSPDWVNNKPAPNTRRPLLGLTPAGIPPSNQVFLNHTNANSDWQGDWLWVGSERVVGEVPLGKYFNLTFTADSSTKKAILYMNGVKVNEFTAGADFVWPNPATTWSWNNDGYDKTGSIKVKNAYFFNKVLTADDAKTLAGGDPKTAILADSQTLLSSELDVSTVAAATTPSGFTAPTGIISNQCVYTCSMDVNIAQTAATWRNIFLGSDPDWPPASTGRRPAVYITGNDAGPANRIHIVHAANEDQNKNIVTAYVAPTGTYFNLTWVVDGGRLITYINGARDSAGTTTGTFTFSSFVWKWNIYAGNNNGSVKVKNMRWWNRALTEGEIKAIAGSTTSTYAMEPWEPYEW